MSVVLIVLLIANITPLMSVTNPVVAVENDVIVGISLPPYGVLCHDVDVKGSPEGLNTLYTLRSGETVELREQPKWEHRDWVMIAPAEWIPLSALCK